MAPLSTAGLLSRLLAILSLLAPVTLLPSLAAANDVSFYNLTTGHVASDVMQVDVVFPRNGVTYKPVYPFPVVFSVSNARVGWPFNIWIIWTIRSLEEDPIASNSFTRDYSRTDPVPVNASEIPDDQWLVIYDVPEILNSSFTEF